MKHNLSASPLVLAEGAGDALRILGRRRSARRVLA